MHQDYALFAFATALLATAPHDDLVLRRTVRRIGLLDPSATFDEDEELHERIERISAGLTADAHLHGQGHRATIC